MAARSSATRASTRGSVTRSEPFRFGWNGPSFLQPFGRSTNFDIGAPLFAVGTRRPVTAIAALPAGSGNGHRDATLTRETSHVEAFGVCFGIYVDERGPEVPWVGGTCCDRCRRLWLGERSVCG